MDEYDMKGVAEGYVEAKKELAYRAEHNGESSVPGSFMPTWFLQDLVDGLEDWMNRPSLLLSILKEVNE